MSRLAILWWITRPFDALVASNSWGLFHPCLEDFPPAHPYRFIDNPNHALRKYLIRPLALTGMDIIFCGNNCGDGRNCAGDCASGACLSKTDRMIMGANTYQEVLTVGGCDTTRPNGRLFLARPLNRRHVSVQARSCCVHALPGIENRGNERAGYRSSRLPARWRRGVLRLCALSSNRQWCRPRRCFRSSRTPPTSPAGEAARGARTSAMESFARWMRTTNFRNLIEQSQ